LIAHRYDPPGSPAHAQVEAVLAARTRDEWDRFARAHDCCLSVVRGLDEALASPLIVEGGMTPPVRTPEGAPGTGLGLPLGLSRTPPEYDRLPPPALGADTEEVLRAAGLSGERLDALLSSVPGSS
jgi:crotonobetainyl-CoA:carnitine CoA-transferase CaiB-like acyl-CoA transferase